MAAILLINSLVREKIEYMNEPNTRNLTRSNTRRMIFGVCGGLGEYFGVDPLVFRIFFLALAFGAGSGVLLYLILTLLIPSEAEAEGPGGGSAIQTRVQEVASELKNRVSMDNRRGWIGMIVVAFGVILLFDRVIPWHFFDWGVFWSIVIIVVGFLLLSAKASNGTSKSSPIVSNTAKTSVPLGTTTESVLHQPQSVVSQTVLPEEKTKRERRRSSGGIGSFLLGIVIVVVGFGLLAENFGFVSTIDLGSLFQFWPIFIIIAGLSLLSRGMWIGKFVSVILAFALVAAIALFFIIPEPAGAPTETPFSFPIAEQAKRLKMNIDTGASSTVIRSSSVPGVAGLLRSNVTRLEAKERVLEGEQMVDLTTQGKVRGFRGRFVNELTVELPHGIPVDLDIDSGASKLDLDLANIMAENIAIDTGASQAKLTLGSASQNAEVRISAGASSITVNVPRGSGVKLVVDAGLSGKLFSGFMQVDDQAYQTEQYAVASSTIEVRIDAGVSNIVVNRI